MRSARTSSVLCVLAAAVFVSTGFSRGEEGPIVLGKPKRPPILTLDPFTGSVGVLALFEYDNSKTRGSSTSSTSALLQENLTLATGGGVISKNFFNWHGSATVGLNENWSHTPTETDTGYAIAPTYDFEGNLLPNSNIPSEFFARRTESYAASSFQPLLKNTYAEYGANFNYLSTKLPTTLNISHTDTTQSTLAGEKEFTLSQDHVGFQTSYEPIERQHLTLDYQYTSVNQNNPGLLNEQRTRGFFSNSYTAQSVGFGHFWQIDPDGRYTLSQNLSYSTEDGTFPFSHLNLSEYLRMRHSDNFESNLQYSYDNQDYFTATTETQQIIGSFTHRLFESLTTHGQAGASTTSSRFSSTSIADGGGTDTNSYFTNLNANYTKHVPYGVLGANFAVGYNQTDNGQVGAVQSVLNDFQTFNDPQPILITRANVDPNSIAVFNAAGTRRYVKNVDYTVERAGNAIEIRRTFASNINSGDTVRLNYDVDPLPGYSATTTNFGGGLRYDFTEGPLVGLGVFAQYSQQDQSTSSAFIRADNITDTTFGADYRIWKLTLRADYEDHQSTLAAFDAARFSALFSDHLSHNAAYSVGASQAFINYPMTHSDTTLTSVDGHLDYLINRDLKAILSARWRNEEDSRFGNTMGFEEQGELRWTIRQTQFFFLLRHTDVEASSNSTDSFAAQFGMTRSF
ncbi:MAG: hypothetical protein ACTHN5_13350 [Phycisphaerae bacterium]